jgi:hypothetical protein
MDEEVAYGGGYPVMQFNEETRKQADAEMDAWHEKQRVKMRDFYRSLQPGPPNGKEKEPSRGKLVET